MKPLTESLRAAAWLWMIVCAIVLSPRAADAQQEQVADAEAGNTPAEVPPHVREARELFLQGAEHVRQARWSEAIHAFQASSKRHPHATTTFNIAACERALGRYTRAWVMFRQALTEHEARGGQLTPALEREAHERITELDALLVRVEVTLVPDNVNIAVDGAPLAKGSDRDGRTVQLAGFQAMGKGRPAPGRSFLLVLDPGAHVVTLSRPGYADALVNRSFLPGTRDQLRLVLERLPATLGIESNVEGAVVSIDGGDVGVAPVEISRPQGAYDVVVRKMGYEPYEATVRLNAGQQANLRAVLVAESEALTDKWWFWAGATAVVAGGATLTYALTRPEPDPPPYDGGSSGWVVVPQWMAF